MYQNNMQDWIPPIAKFAAPVDIWDHIDIALVRERKAYASNRTQGVRIQLGAGNKHIDGWDNLDYPDWKAEDGLLYESDSVFDVASYHTLDHLEPDVIIYTLKEIQRVLSPGGTFTNIVPHYSSQLANECLMHKSRFAIDTWRNIFSERQYDGAVDGRDFDWHFDIRVNFIYGITERNLVLVTQLEKNKWPSV